MKVAIDDVTAPPRTTVFVGSVNLIAQIADKLFSFGQIVVIAAFLGASADADLLFLASIVPLMIGYVVGEPIGRAFLTLLVRETQRQRARRLAASAFLLTLGALIAVTALYVATAFVLVTVFTPGGTGSLAPWLILSLIAPCAGVAGLLSGVLLWLNHYSWSAARVPIASGFGLVFLLIAAWISGSLVWISAALAAGYGISALLTYLRVGQQIGLGWGFAASRSDILDAVRVKELIVGPVVGGAIGGQVIVTLERLFAAGFVGTGAVAIVSYSRGIATAPTVFAQAVGASGYPRAVRAEAAGDTGFLRESFVRGMRLAIFFGLSCTAFLVLFGPAAVGAVLERGKFGQTTSDQTGHVLIAFAAAAFSGSLIAYLVPFIYGLNRFGSIIWVELAIFVVYIIAAPAGAVLWGLTGLAIAFAVAQMCGVLVAVDVCRRALGLAWSWFARVALGPILLPVAVVVVVQLAYRIVLDHTQQPVELRGLVRVGGSMLLLLVAMSAVLLLSSLPEAAQLRRFLRRGAQSVQ